MSADRCIFKRIGENEYKIAIQLILFLFSLLGILLSTFPPTRVSAAGGLIPNPEGHIGLKEINGENKRYQICNNDGYEPDNNYLQAQTIPTNGLSQSHVNTPTAEEDWVKFNAISGDKYEIRTRLTNDIDMYDGLANDTLLYLYSTDGITLTELAFNDDVGYATWYQGYYYYRESIITWTAPANGVYYVRELQWNTTARDCHTYELWVTDLNTTPMLSLSKTSTTALVTFAGQVINYDYLLTNTTNITLTGITLSDNNTDSTPNCPQTSLFVGYSMTCTASHTVTQAELDTGGNLTNTALASSVEGGQTSSQLGIPIWQNPSLDLSKNVAEANYSAVGDVLHYSLATTNTGNVTLSNVSIADPLLGFLACTPTQPTSLAPVATLSCTGSHTITQADLDAGQFNNTANASGSFGGSPVNATPAGQSVPAVQNPLIGVAKRVVSVIGVSTGTYDVMYEIRVHNYGNVTLNAVQITDDLTSTFPPPNTFQVLSIIGSGLVVDNSFNGIANVNLLASGNSLASDAGGTINIVARIIPTSSGPFSNTALGFGTSPLDTTVTDLSQDGSNPDPDGDGNPLNNNDPTLFNLGPQLFDPPYGIKSVDTSGAPVLTWTLVWINTSNIVAVNAVVHDPISINTTFSATLVDSGYPVPSGAPFGSTSFGVACTTTSLITVTTLCYFEGPTIANPRGQIIWAGTLGPDPGITDPVAAENAIHISFNVSAAPNVTNGQNVSTVDADLNGNGNTTDPGEQQVALATASWSITPPTLPRTGFTLGQVSILPEQPKELAYRDLGDLWLEIPRLGVNMNIVGVPQTKGEWDVSWLGSNAGWLQGSAYPTWAGNSVLTGHVWNADNTAGPFRYITTLCYGDKVIIHAGGAQYVYEVRSVMQVGPGNINALMKHEEMPWVTLVTCRGYDTTTGTYHYRVLVRAVLVEVK